MQVIVDNEKLRQITEKLKEKGETIGFVPTMGALHEGHLSLIEISIKGNNHTICSIFVNPTQFTNPADLVSYPRTLEKDIQLLEKKGCSYVYIPQNKDIYPTNYKSITPNFDYLERVLEGEFRPGHFQGVANVVKRLFDLVAPSKAYFGEKDFQQVAIIQQLVDIYDIPVEIVPCPILREKNGLAMSSRNELLTGKQRQKAGQIYSVLKIIHNNFKKEEIEQLELQGTRLIEDDADFSVEYFKIVDQQTLLPATNDTVKFVICIAVNLGKVRLIDNFTFIP